MTMGLTATLFGRAISDPVTTMSAVDGWSAAASVACGARAAAGSP
ncbi:hypothetical protein ACFOKF_25480 [Sphingobium rhizovicinum]|uniref:Uncharacterized protein n=1 Tax=Sphingobium rhizovicinum TaxID=432308 RepID=A0ABV7NPT3_9SPHN